MSVRKTEVRNIGNQIKRIAKAGTEGDKERAAKLQSRLDFLKVCAAPPLHALPCMLTVQEKAAPDALLQAARAPTPARAIVVFRLHSLVFSDLVLRGLLQHQADCAGPRSRPCGCAAENLPPQGCAGTSAIRAPISPGVSLSLLLLLPIPHRRSFLSSLSRAAPCILTPAGAGPGLPCGACRSTRGRGEGQAQA